MWNFTKIFKDQAIAYWISRIKKISTWLVPEEEGTEILETPSSLSVFRKAHLKETSVRKLCSPGEVLGYDSYISVHFLKLP